MRSGHVDQVEDSDPWGDCSGESVVGEENGEEWGVHAEIEDHHHETKAEDGRARAEDDIDIPLLRDPGMDPSLRAVVRAVAKEGFRAGVALGEDQSMQVSTSVFQERCWLCREHRLSVIGCACGTFMVCLQR